MGSLKDALVNAGFESTKPVVKKKTTTTRGPRKKVHTHQSHQTVCGNCNKSTPDVEFYNHRSKITRARWLCVICADENSISDETRETNQSEYSRKNIFRREFGRTKRF